MDRWSVLHQDTLFQKYPGTTVNQDTHGMIQKWLIDLFFIGDIKIKVGHYFEQVH